jgi:4-amino-4-deoxy-L-arabinose transferase-like glycosyltransferase
VAVIAAIVVALLSISTYERAGYNRVPIQLTLGTVSPGTVACQPHEPLPAGTRALRFYVAPLDPRRVAARVLILGAGQADGRGAPATVAPGPSLIAPLPHEISHDTTTGVCLEVAGSTGIGLQGTATGAADQIVIEHSGRPVARLIGRARIDDLVSSKPASAWTVIGNLPQRITAATGTALAPWLAGSGLLLGGLSLCLLLANPAATGVKRDLVLIAVITFGLGAFWAGITPALQKTDETAHFEYVQAFSELGHPPLQFADSGLVSDEFACWYSGLQVAAYRFDPTGRPPWSPTLRLRLDRQCRPLSRRYDGAMYHAYQPPLYYGLGSLAYLAGYRLALPTRLMLVRLVSVLIGCAFVALCYLLVRELVPLTPWAARSAALAVALQPVVMFNLSGVNPDGLYSAAAAGIAFLAARAWRRGTSLPLALGLGGAVGVGLISKSNFLAVLPAAIVLAGALGFSERRRAKLVMVRLLSGAAVALAIFGLYALINDSVWHRGLTYSPPAFGASGGSLHRFLSFTWQFFLPRLPGMHNLVGSPFIPFWHDLVRGILTRLGWWDDYGLGSAWLAVLLVVGVLLALAATRYALPRARRHGGALLVIAACVVTYIAAQVYADYRFTLAGSDGMEGRYVLPLMPAWALLVGAAIALVRSRWRPSATALVAVGSLGYSAAAAIATVARFYL